MTRTTTQRDEPSDLTAGRERLAAARAQRDAIRTELAQVPSGKWARREALADRAASLDDEERAAERALRETWARVAAPPIIEAGYPAVLDAVADYVAAVEAMYRVRERAVEARAAFNAAFQAGRQTVPVENGWPDRAPAPPMPPPPPMIDDGGLADWGRRVLREFEGWRATWMPGP